MIKLIIDDGQIPKNRLIESPKIGWFNSYG